MRITGVVTWYNDSRGFGFIKPEGGRRGDCFVHHSALRGSSDAPLHPGEIVEFEVVQGAAGPIARNVLRLTA